MKLVTVLTITLMLASTGSYANVSRNNGVNWDKNGNPVCTYGQLKSCGYAAAQGNQSAAAYLDQRTANNPNPNKTTFYNYNPPSPTQNAAKTGISQSQAQAAQISYNAQQAAAKAKADAEAAKRQASYEAAQRTAASLAAETAKQAAALKAAQQKQNDKIALQQLAAKTAAQKTAADKAAADLAAKQQAAQQAVADRAKLANQVASQVTSSGASCNGYWQGGRCVNNGQVAYSGGSPVNVMNQPKSTWAGAGKRQTCTLVYTYKAGRVVGSPRSVCTIS